MSDLYKFFFFFFLQSQGLKYKTLVSARSEAEMDFILGDLAKSKLDK